MATLDIDEDFRALSYEVLPHFEERAVAQVVSHRLPTAGARVRDRGKSCAIGGWSGKLTGVLRVLRLPCQLFSPPIASESLSIIQGWYNRPTNGISTSRLAFNPAKKITYLEKFNAGIICCVLA
jgi:hypothetical protein